MAMERMEVTPPTEMDILKDLSLSSEGRYTMQTRDQSKVNLVISIAFKQTESF